MENNQLAPTNDDALQFDRAQPVSDDATASTLCTGCKRAITGTYFEIGGKIFCEQCREAVIRTFQGGSPIGRFLKALFLGLIAAIFCSAGWLLIVKVTGYAIGLVAIVVGVVVGLAVRKGTGGRGGWVYQGMAVILTYLAISASYVPDIVEAFSVGEVERETALVKSDKERSRITIERDGSVKLNEAKSSPDEAVKEMERLKSVDGFVMYFREGRKEVSPPASSDIVASKWVELKIPVVYSADSQFQNIDSEALGFWNATAIGKISLILISLFIAVQVPFLDLPAHAIGLLIIGFALWEAWKINKRRILRISGPHVLMPRSPAAGIQPTLNSASQ